jgi:orotate phosphoribosyltransferase
MIFNKQTAGDVAELLLQIKAIKLQPANPFTWASGWKSPIYCDNRLTLSFPAVRETIARQLAQLIKTHYPETEVIAAVATGAIAHGALVAHLMNLPLIYIRPAPKAHGLGNLIEGHLPDSARVCVVEDLVSTGKSSLQAVDALRQTNARVLGMAAIFSYGFQQAEAAFEQSGCPLFTLTDYSHLIDKALEMSYVAQEEAASLNNWRIQPEIWGQ